jgi:hypothetical protein
MPPFNSGLDKEAFLRYLDNFDAVADPEKLLKELSDCADPLPLRQAQSLGLPVGASYRDAVRLLLGSWTSS